MTNETFLSAAIELIVTSPTNPRKTFNASKLAELAESIKASGVNQPILLRPLPGSRVPETGKKVQYEIVAGERRFRASKIAGLSSIPAMVRSLTDLQVLEIQLIENLQREDLSELEEAEGYQTLHTTLGEHKGLSADEIAKRIGKSRRYVYNRLKLLDTAPEVQAALRDGKIDASRALVIGTIRRMSDQVEALEVAIEPDYTGESPSVRELQKHIRSRFFLEIRQIPWSETQGNIAGQAACSECTKRSDREAEQDLFDQDSGPALCLDADCYESKFKAHTQAKIDHWRKIGVTFKTRNEAVEEGLLRHIWSDMSANNNGSAILASQVREDLPEPHTGKTIGRLLGKDVKGIITYAIESLNEKKPAQLYYDRKQVAEALKAKGIELESEEQDDDDQEKGAKGNKQHEERLRARKASQRVQKAITKALGNAPSPPKGIMANEEILRFLCKEFFEYGSHDVDEIAIAIGQPELASGEEQLDIEAYIDQASGFELTHLFFVERILDMMDSTHLADWQDGALQTMLNALCINRAEIEAQVKAEIEAEEQKTTPPEVPAAQPKGCGEGAQLAPLKRASAKKVDAKKLSAEEAEQGIAEAMQGLDEAASASAVAPPASGLIGIGNRVQVTSKTDSLTAQQFKRAGKIGTVKSKEDDSIGIWVSFAGRNGGEQLFNLDQLELAPA